MRAMLYLAVAITLVCLATPAGAEDAVDYMKRGVEMIKKGEYDKAITDCDEALRLNPDLAQGGAHGLPDGQRGAAGGRRRTGSGCRGGLRTQYEEHDPVDVRGQAGEGLARHFSGPRVGDLGDEQGATPRRRV